MHSLQVFKTYDFLKYFIAFLVNAKKNDRLIKICLSNRFVFSLKAKVRDMPHYSIFFIP